MIPSLRAVLMGCLLLAGCGGGDERAVVVTQPSSAPGAGQAEWRGVLACADCDGIDTRLSLSGDDAGQYRLVEVFVLGGDAVPFVEEGRWRRDGELIRLEGSDHSRRFFALTKGGGVQPRDARNRPFANHHGDVLQPATPAEQAP